MNAPRTRRAYLRGALTAIGVGATSLALLLVAFEVADRRDDASSFALHTRTRATSDSTSSSSSPATTTAPTAAVRPSPRPGPTTIDSTTVTPTSIDSATETTSPLSDLLDETDRGAALPEQREARPRPVALQTSEIDVTSYPIRPIGLKPDGELEIPDETQIGWYRYGATAGRDGATVLAAHVSWNGTNGPFAQLDRLEPGSQIEVALDDGSRRNYVVTEQALYEKEGLPRERLWRNTGPETLVLITCGGDFNPEIRRFKHNIVVYASPLG